MRGAYFSFTESYLIRSLLRFSVAIFSLTLEVASRRTTLSINVSIVYMCFLLHSFSP
jgi:hypothetical protein